MHCGHLLLLLAPLVLKVLSSPHSRSPPTTKTGFRLAIACKIIASWQPQLTLRAGTGGTSLLKTNGSEHVLQDITAIPLLPGASKLGIVCSIAEQLLDLLNASQTCVCWCVEEVERSLKWEFGLSPPHSPYSECSMAKPVAKLQKSSAGCWQCRKGQDAR